MDTTTRALIAQQKLSDLQDARLNGADVSPLEYIALQKELEAALAAEAAPASPASPAPSEQLTLGEVAP